MFLKEIYQRRYYSAIANMIEEYSYIIRKLENIYVNCGEKEYSDNGPGGELDEYLDNKETFYHMSMQETVYKNGLVGVL